MPTKKEIAHWLSHLIREIRASSLDSDYREELEEAFWTLMWALGFSNEEIGELLNP